MLTHHEKSPVAPARVVVLGAGGFVGQKLADVLLAQGIDHLLLGRGELDLAAEGAGERLAGLLRPQDSVVMLAAVTPDKGKGISPFMRNLRMAEALCAALDKASPRHVVYASSDAVYPFGEGVTSEASRAEPPDLYGMMHLARERMIESATAAPLARLRPSLIYGAADTHNSYGPNRFFRQARQQGRIALFGNGEETRDHIAVEDVVTLIMLVLKHRSAGVLNIATGASIAFGDLARQVAALAPQEVSVEGSPRQNPVTHRHYDITAIRCAFPRFAFTPLETGLRRAAEEFWRLT